MNASFDRSSVSLNLIETEQLIKQKEDAIANLEFQLEMLKKDFEKMEFSKNQVIERLTRENEQNKQTVVDMTELIRTNSKSENSLDADKALYKLQIENNNLKKEVHLLRKRAKSKPSSGRDIDVRKKPRDDEDKTVDVPLADESHRRGTDLQSKPSAPGNKTLDPPFERRNSHKSSDPDAAANPAVMIRQFEERLMLERARFEELEKYNHALAEQLHQKAASSDDTFYLMQKQEKEKEKLVLELEERGKTINNLQEITKHQRIELEELRNYRNKTAQSLLEKSTALYDFETVVKELNSRYIDLNNKYLKLDEKYNVDTNEMGNTIAVLEKRKMELETDNERLKLQNANQLEKITEYLGKIERYQETRNVEIVEARQSHERETLKLNIKINDLLKELRDEQLEKKQLVDQNFNLKLKAGEVVDSFRVLGAYQNPEGVDPDVSRHEASPEDDKQPVRLDRFDTMSYESLNLDRGLKQGQDILINEDFGRRDSLDRDGLETKSTSKPTMGVIGGLPGDDISARYGGPRALNRSKFAENQYLSNFSQNAPKIKTSVIKSFRDNRPAVSTSKRTNNVDTRGQGISTHEISQIISKNIDADNLTELCQDLDDPLIHYIEELDEKNTEIMNLKQEIHNLKEAGGVEALKAEVQTLQAKIRQLESQIADNEASWAKERDFNQRNYDDLCDQLVKQKLRVSAVMVEKDSMWAKMSKRIKQLTYQVQIYEEQIKELNGD